MLSVGWGILKRWNLNEKTGWASRLDKIGHWPRGCDLRLMMGFSSLARFLRAAFFFSFFVFSTAAGSTSRSYHLFRINDLCSRMP